MSDDGRAAIVVIALVGSPFSPTYARARARGPASPLAHAALNVAIYGRDAAWFSLRERPVSSGDRFAAGICLGSNSVRWDGDALVVNMDERTTPFGRPIRGRVVLHPEITTDLDVAIDRGGAHRWWPVAPLARIEVDLAEPSISFRGHGYHDANEGAIPLEASFDAWSWSRARTPRGPLLTYDVREVDGATTELAMRVDRAGVVSPIDGTALAALPTTLWGLPRHVRADEGAPSRVTRALEDGPFYARALVDTRIDGTDITAMHEVLSAERLRRGWVRFLTGFRMGRAG